MALVHFRYKLALLENSSITGESNIQFITNYLNFFGLYVYSFVLKAEEYKSPIRRERQYFIILPVHNGDFDQTAEDFTQPDWIPDFVKCLEALKSGPGDPMEFLLGEDDYNVWLAEVLWPGRI